MSLPIPQNQLVQIQIQFCMYDSVPRSTAFGNFLEALKSTPNCTSPESVQYLPDRRSATLLVERALIPEALFWFQADSKEVDQMTWLHVTFGDPTGRGCVTVVTHTKRAQALRRQREEAGSQRIKTRPMRKSRRPQVGKFWSLGA